MKRLITIQQTLKAPKNQHNNFGNYNYRSCEDILTAVKPLLDGEKLALTLSDEIVLIGERYYVIATASLYDEDGRLIHSTNAAAREEGVKKGMDSSQITGSSSSYARKYALCGLFAIDDGIDSDSTNTGEQKEENSKPRFNYTELNKLKGEREYVKQFGDSDSLIKAISGKYNISKLMKIKIADIWASQ